MKLSYFKNTSLLRNIIDSVWKLFYYNKSHGVVLTSLCVRVIMCVRASIKAYIYIYIYKNWSPPNVQDMVTALAQMVEHGASNAKIMGSIPRESKS